MNAPGAKDGDGLPGNRFVLPYLFGSHFCSIGSATPAFGCGSWPVMQHSVFANASDQIGPIRQLLEYSLIGVASVDSHEQSPVARGRSIEGEAKPLDGSTAVDRDRALLLLLPVLTPVLLGRILAQLSSRRCVVEPHRDGTRGGGADPEWHGQARLHETLRADEVRTERRGEWGAPVRHPPGGGAPLSGGWGGPGGHDPPGPRMA